MFTGIIEDQGHVVSLVKDGTNLNITLRSNFTNELKIDQSIAHNGVCLTVTHLDNKHNIYTVTAIEETLDKTTFRSLHVNDTINLERAMKLGDRLDGHIVQGHVDQTGKCINIKESNGSWVFTFEYNPINNNITIEKGSITINGVSLTVIDSRSNTFSVAIIPYTYEHTNFNKLKIGDPINLEFDVIGKYVARLTTG
jgi:riboflavin synthase